MLKNIDIDAINSLVQIAYYENKHVTFLTKVMSTELELIPSASMLFRENTVATRLTSAYMKLIGSDYMEHTITDLVKQVLDDPSGYEVSRAGARGWREDGALSV